MSTALNPEASAQVLRNAGIPVKTYSLAVDEAGALVEPYERAIDSQGEPVQEWRYVRISNAVLAMIESPAPTGWGSIGAWERELETVPFRAISQTLALCWGMVSNVGGLPAADVQRAATVLLDGSIEDYSLAVANAFLLAQGVDPQRVGEHLAAEVRNLLTQREAIGLLVQEETESTNKRREDFVETQKQQNSSAAAEPTPTSPATSVIEDPIYSEPSAPGFDMVMTSAPSGT